QGAGFGDELLGVVVGLDRGVGQHLLASRGRRSYTSSTTQILPRPLRLPGVGAWKDRQIDQLGNRSSTWWDRSGRRLLLPDHLIRDGDRRPGLGASQLSLRSFLFGSERKDPIHVRSSQACGLGTILSLQEALQGALGSGSTGMSGHSAEGSRIRPPES